MTWREIQQESARFAKVPLQSLWRMWEKGEVFPKYRRKDNRERRHRVTVSPELHAHIKREAQRAGCTMGEWVERVVLGGQE